MGHVVLRTLDLVAEVVVLIVTRSVVVDIVVEPECRAGVILTPCILVAVILGIARTYVDAGPVHLVVEAQVAELQSVATGLAIDKFTVILDEGTVVVGGVTLVGHRQLERAVNSLRMSVNLHIV